MTISFIILYALLCYVLNNVFNNYSRNIATKNSCQYSPRERSDYITVTTTYREHLVEFDIYRDSYSPELVEQILAGRRKQIDTKLLDKCYIANPMAHSFDFDTLKCCKCGITEADARLSEILCVALEPDEP